MSGSNLSDGKFEHNYYYVKSTGKDGFRWNVHTLEPRTERGSGIFTTEIKTASAKIYAKKTRGRKKATYAGATTNVQISCC